MKRKKAMKVLWALEKVQRICERQGRCEGCVFEDDSGAMYATCLLDEPLVNLDMGKLKKRLLQAEESTKGNTDGER